MRICLVQLGRYGDLINILPVARDMAVRHGHDVYIAVCDAFADLLMGVSYAQPFHIPGDDFMAGQTAAEHARQSNQFDRVILTRTPGTPGTPGSSGGGQGSFATDAWQAAGYDHLWDELPLVFDLRDAAREADLVAQVLGAHETAKPVILMALKGVSAPFDRSAELRQSITDAWSQSYYVADISDLHAKHIYDLLGLMDRASLLISADTAHLHLSYSSMIPTIALTNDGPSRWHRTAPRKHWLLDVPYSLVMPQLRRIHVEIARRRAQITERGAAV